jgi:hypothetical protein
MTVNSTSGRSTGTSNSTTTDYSTAIDNLTTSLTDNYKAIEKNSQLRPTLQHSQLYIYSEFLRYFTDTEIPTTREYMWRYLKYIIYKKIRQLHSYRLFYGCVQLCALTILQLADNAQLSENVGGLSTYFPSSVTFVLIQNTSV